MFDDENEYFDEAIESCGSAGNPQDEAWESDPRQILREQLISEIKTQLIPNLEKENSSNLAKFTGLFYDNRKQAKINALRNLICNLKQFTDKSIKQVIETTEKTYPALTQGQNSRIKQRLDDYINKENGKFSSIYKSNKL